MSRRDDNRRARREALVDAAARLFAEGGYEGTTVDQIAEAAGLSRRTCFRYFAGKEDLAFPDHADRLALFAQAIAGEGPAWDRVRGGFVSLGHQLTAERQRVVRQQRVIESSPALVAADRARDLEWEAVVARALSSDWGPADAPVVAGALMGAIRVVLRRWFADDGSGDLVAQGLAAFDRLEQGLRPPDSPAQRPR